MTHWRLRLCGGEALVQCGHGQVRLPDIAWPILGCLAAAKHYRTTRARLTVQLWPEQDEDSARHRLATALWRVRSAVAGALPLIRSEGDVLALDLAPTLWVDALALERRLATIVSAPDRLAHPVERRRITHVLRAYRGEFLADRDQDWIVIQRARLRALHLDALYALAAASARAGSWAEALGHAVRLCEAEPLREDAQRLLMEAHARCGNRALALQQFRQCATILARELGVAPMAETRALAAEIAGREMAGDAVDLPPIDLRAALTQVRSRTAETLAIVDRALSG